MDVVAVDISCGKSGITGVAEVSDGIVIGTLELNSPVSVSEALECLKTAFGSSGVGRRLLVVEKPYGGKSVREDLNLARTEAMWSTLGALLGATVLTPTASEWRARSNHGGFRGLDRWLSDKGIPRPRLREAWKSVACQFVREVVGLDVSNHVAEAVCMALWGEEQAAARNLSVILDGCEVLDGVA